MAEVVYILGAGFNCSVLDASRGLRAPLSRTFFQVLLGEGRLGERIEGIRSRLFVDLLLEEIERYWKLDISDLARTPFDIEECLTMFESQLKDNPPPERELDLRRAVFALRNLLLMYLGEMSYGGYTPAAQQFGAEVLTTGADTLTFNYDSLAEEAIESASGIGPKPVLSTRPDPTHDRELPDENLDASHLAWKRPLAYGFQFDEVSLPIAGVSPQISGDRYYAHPANHLYAATRVLKLHGSIDWLKYTPTRIYPPDFEPDALGPSPEGIVLERHPQYWMGESPTRNGLYMEPAIIPPQLYKDFQEWPISRVWELAMESLAGCRTLVVVGYSFPSTDFRTRRLFLETFADHTLQSLVVVDPHPRVVAAARHLTHYSGPAVTCDNLSSLYGLSTSWSENST